MGNDGCRFAPPDGDDGRDAWAGSRQGRVFTAARANRRFREGSRSSATGSWRSGRGPRPRAAPPDARVIDVAGRAILPGFVDAHDHLASPAPSSPPIDVRYPGVAWSVDLFGADRSGRRANTRRQWIRAFGMSPEMFRDGRRPTRWDLDEATRVHPVLVQHMSGHHALANSLGFEHRGLDDDVLRSGGRPPPPRRRGRLTGYCLDAAQQLVVPPARRHWASRPRLPRRCAARGDRGRHRRGRRASLAAGITSVVDAQVTRRELDGYRKARRRGLLGVRITLMPISSQLDEYEALGLAGRFGDDGLAIGPMKFYADGALTGGTAAFTEPYGRDGEFTGSLYWSAEDDFRAAITRAHALAGRSACTPRATARSTASSMRTPPRWTRPPRRPPASHRALRGSATRPGRPDGIPWRDGRRPATLLLGRWRRLARRP